MADFHFTPFTPIECNHTKYNRQHDDTEDFTVEHITARMTHVCGVITPFAAILNSEIVQFFTRDHWSLLPLEWRDFLSNLSVEELAVLMDAGQDFSKDTQEAVPKSLLTIRQEIKKLSLSRKQAKYHRLTAIYPGTDKEQDEFRQLYEHKTQKLMFYDNLLSFDKKQPPLSLLKYKCKDKKLAEIVVMGDLVFKASLINKVDFVVDIGSGLGHLSRCLAYFYGMNVVAIEMQAEMTEEAHRLDAKFLKQLRSHARKDAKYDHISSGSGSGTITRITCEVKPDITPQEFQNMIQTGYNFDFGLVGLHPCGNLAPTMLNLYKNCGNCQFINIASCCYNKMSLVNDKSATYIGFPLSMNIPLMVDMEMGRNQLGLALHALESHQERFKHDIGSFKADFYRALVEKFIESIAPQYKDLRRRNVKTGMTGTTGVKCFEEYLKQSLPEVVLDARVFNTLENIDENVEFHKILAFSALRHMFAPLIETIVLLDRLIYLKQDSDYCHLTQRFDPRISPRVHVITAFKKSMQQ